MAAIILNKGMAGNPKLTMAMLGLMGLMLRLEFNLGAVAFVLSGKALHALLEAHVCQHPEARPASMDEHRPTWH
ncbi:MAG: hypothetical protein V4488_23835 [Pseudomonadota bacterium]